MAILLLEDGTIVRDMGAIADELFPLGIWLKHFDPGMSLLFPNLAEQDVLTTEEKQYILELHDSQFEFLKRQGNYVWSDLLVLHPGSPTLDMVLKTYGRCHAHTAPEALYMLSGELVIGFVYSDGRQAQLLLQSQDYIHIPHGVEHWSSLTASLTVKAVRYFTTADGWVPQYTGTIFSNFVEK
ncbi:MAG TPA: hypothetical protein V6C78_29590 [Crinalium sp.]|jgi:1,2-dihydroxy-3-keto-5-methylthiopentene dioxygenase